MPPETTSDSYSEVLSSLQYGEVASSRTYKSRQDERREECLERPRELEFARQNTKMEAFREGVSEICLESPLSLWLNTNPCIHNVKLHRPCK